MGQDIDKQADGSMLDHIPVISGAPKEYQEDTVFISGIPPHVTVEQIGDMFGSIGIIKVCRILASRWD